MKRVTLAVAIMLLPPYEEAKPLPDPATVLDVHVAIVKLHETTQVVEFTNTYAGREVRIMADTGKSCRVIAFSACRMVLSNRNHELTLFNVETKEVRKRALFALPIS